MRRWLSGKRTTENRDLSSGATKDPPHRAAISPNGESKDEWNGSVDCRSTRKR